MNLRLNGFSRIVGMLLLLGFGLLQEYCANPVTPTGGPRDLSAPKLDSSKTTPNFSTNFKEEEIVLAFEHWVKLNDVSNQVIVSPFLETKPEIRLKGKKVLVRFKEELKENTTYTISFGNSIQTLTESKADENFKFVFSTGPEIDSLSLSGTVANALDKEPVEDFYVLLYDQLEDSVIFSQRPYYFAKTDKQGKFKLENIKSDTFQVFALKDQNFNYNFDLPSEQLGFMEKHMILTDSTDKPIIKLLVFQEAQSLKLSGKRVMEPGLVRFTFNQEFAEPVKIALDPADASVYMHTEAKKDSIMVWIDRFNQKQQFILSDGKDFLDTVELSFPDKSKLKKPAPMVRKATTAPRGVTGKGAGKGGVTQAPAPNAGKGDKAPIIVYSHNPDKPIRVEMTQPINSVDITKLSIQIDSSETISPSSFSIDPESPRTLLIEEKWQINKRYDLTFEAGAANSVFGLPSIPFKQSFTILDRKSFGTIIAKAQNLDSTKNYLIELVDRADAVLDRVEVQGQSEFEKTYNTMEVKSYQLRILEDNNQNGRWDTGNYKEGRQAESLYFSGHQSMRPNWDMELEVVLPIKE